MSNICTYTVPPSIQDGICYALEGLIAIFIFSNSKFKIWEIFQMLPSGQLTRRFNKENK